MHIGDERPGCSIPFFLLVCAPVMAVKMSWNAQWTAIGPILSSSLTEPWKLQLIQLIGPFTGILVAPAVGVHSDRCTSKYGQRRPYMFISALLTCICWGIMAYLKDWCGGNNDLYVSLTVICYVWMDITCNVLQMVTYLLIADVAGPRQVTGAAIAYLYGVVGQMVVSLYISLAKSPVVTNQLPSFFAMLISIMVITVVPVCYFVRENPWQAIRRLDPRVAEFESEYPVRPTTIWTAWRVGIQTLPGPLAIYALALGFAQTGYHAYNTVKTGFFGVNIYHGANCMQVNCTADQKEKYDSGVNMASGAADQFYNAVAMLFLIFLPILIQRMGARNVVIASFMPQCLFIVMAFIHPVWLSVLIVGLAAPSQYATLALQVPLIIHVCGIGDEKVVGLYLGALNTAICVGQIVTFILSSVLSLTTQGNMLMVLLGGVFSALALGIMHFKFQVKMHSW
ncbi:hypothetical protein Ae201684_012750 [Aphanomyces euteiches]|uniref:Major facilitator superfamily (MFS) profile domain-containing protein n=1 Tax=Aphanomyces euteiches TaxID=100861 RepID=A0A6G0WQM6_9STRA|nr:hypothetical protein Ae201684_012750 [Aphanomyces euteiches]KAH9154274.1 hypothetical protein AeRB84_003602 [Aphanomyces euteiches]